ncbi:tripartite tricarboxylate transporter substrate-binding protein [Falsiroseomonas selenitidurans]|uniref:Tripartite tricarboxylate transporter substrate binding protein n=1 Tax=Falsiroseomonas selenitidurans TaxID=2716335 RepID=A0ABX1DX55_9PROT|nr:tripartite tricarboxylate transporter substrate-binding protein [Falsiroseomonas selenitidurans]NKC29509.1 tripartite tricarboxylate transporter substrate binding protein [Falsiroseomonas selenitidurans]
MNRRHLLPLLAAPFILSRGSAAQGWPPGSLRIIVPFAPGSFTDISARLLAQELTGQLGQSVVVENRGGAGGTVGATAAVRAVPDGLTLLLTDNSLAISPSLYPALPYNPLTDLVQVSRIADSPSILLVRPGLGARDVAALVAMAKARPGALSFGSGGQGSSAHLAMELLLNVTGTRMLHVPFRGVAAAINEVIAGRVDMAIASLASGVAHVRAGTLHGLGVTGASRAAALPQVPTFIEAGVPRYDMMYWWGVAAPKGTPEAVVTRLNTEIGTALRSPKLVEAFAAAGASATHSTPAAMAAHVAREVALWREVVQRAGVKLE